MLRLWFLLHFITREPAILPLSEGKAQVRALLIDNSIRQVSAVITEVGA